MALTVAQLVARLTADTSNFYRGMALANASMIRSGGIISRVAAGAGLATLGMGIMSLRAAGNFQQSMNILEAVSNATTRQMSLLRGEAIALGKDFKLPNVSAKDAADSMTELAKAGLSVKDIMSATRGTLQLGLAANIGFSDSAVIVARTLKMFNLEGSKATMIANLLAAGANKSTAEINDLAYGMQNAGAQFQGAGYNVQDLVVALSALVDRGLLGEQAGTALKVMLQRLENPTKKAAAEMDALGVNIADAHGKMLPLPQIVEQFARGFEHLNPLQRQQALYTIFGSRANQAMGKLLQIGQKGWKDYGDAIVGTNAAQAIAEARTKGFNGAIGAIGSAVETLAIQLGTSLLPAATQVGFAIANFISHINPAAIVAFFSAIAGGVGFIYNLVAGSTLLQSIIVGLIAAFTAYKIAMMAAAAAQAVFNAAMAVFDALVAANPIVLIIAALIGLAAALYMAYQRSEAFRNAVNGVFSFLQGSVLPILAAIGAAIKSAFISAWNTVQPLVSAMAQFIKAHWELIKSISEVVFKAISAYIRAEVFIWRSIIIPVIEAIVSFIQSHWNTIRSITQAIWSAISAVIRAQIAIIVGVIRTLTVIVQVVTAIFNAVKEAMVHPLQTAKALVHAAVAAVIGGIKALAGEALAAGLAIGRAIGEGIVNGIKSMAGAIASAASSAVHGAVSGIKGALHIGSPSGVTRDEIGKPLAEGIIVGYLLGIRELPDKVKESIKNALEAGRQLVQNAISQYQTAFQNLANKALQAFDAITQQHLTPAERMLAALQKAEDLKRMADAIVSAQKKLADAGVPTEKIQAYTAALEMQRQATLRLSQAQEHLAELRAKGAGQDAIDQAQRQVNQAQSELAAINKAVADAKASLAAAGTDPEAAMAAADELQQAELEKTKYYLELQAEEQRKQYEAQRELQREHLQAQLDQLEAALQRHPERWRFYMNKIAQLLKSYGVTFSAAGKALGLAFAEGMREAFAAVEKTAKAIAELVKKYLKLGSPAEAGPLSTLNKWWDAFAPTLLSGLDTNAIERALTSTLSPGYASPSALTSAVGGVGASGVQIYAPVYVQGSVVTERELADVVYDRLHERGRFTSTLWGGR